MLLKFILIKLYLASLNRLGGDEDMEENIYEEISFATSEKRTFFETLKDLKNSIVNFFQDFGRNGDRSVFSKKSNGNNNQKLSCTSTGVHDFSTQRSFERRKKPGQRNRSLSLNFNLVNRVLDTKESPAAIHPHSNLKSKNRTSDFSLKKLFSSQKHNGEDSEVYSSPEIETPTKSITTYFNSSEKNANRNNSQLTNVAISYSTEQSEQAVKVRRPPNLFIRNYDVFQGNDISENETAGDELTDNDDHIYTPMSPIQYPFDSGEYGPTESETEEPIYYSINDLFLDTQKQKVKQDLKNTNDLEAFDSIFQSEHFHSIYEKDSSLSEKHETNSLKSNQSENIYLSMSPIICSKIPFCLGNCLKCRREPIFRSIGDLSSVSYSITTQTGDAIHSIGSNSLTKDINSIEVNETTDHANSKEHVDKNPSDTNTSPADSEMGK
ncbi:hypothetical protein TUBRATIS_14210 [Tubulinosema ratisbonensis]|uniref:Uncharacterized protein n=1 Tax=Tubulinosema ratisbonensis TaxID=291195 RepID=A0A437ALK9_9MICR|nr:hypothetical protein TUBRATIS_14210 [Tubulinosema ratisbonensis]